MGKSTYIHLVDGSKQKECSLDDVLNLLNYYQKMTHFTGQQLNWEYDSTAFPYDIKEQEKDGYKYLELISNEHNLYSHLFIGTGQNEHGINYIQIVLPSDATHGDQSKANELAKFLSNQLIAELHLFNGRIMNYTHRK